MSGGQREQAKFDDIPMILYDLVGGDGIALGELGPVLGGDVQLPARGVQLLD